MQCKFVRRRHAKNIFGRRTGFSKPPVDRHLVSVNVWRDRRAFNPSQIARHFLDLLNRPIEHRGNLSKVARSYKLGAQCSHIVTGPDLIHALSTIRNIAGDFGFFDGTMCEVDDAYILRDGEACIVDMMFVDAGRGMTHDGRGNAPGQRPGFLISDDERAAQAVRDAYAAYDAALSTRWQSNRWQSEPPKPAPSAPQIFDSAEAALADAYRQYDRDISERGANELANPCLRAGGAIGG